MYVYIWYWGLCPVCIYIDCRFVVTMKREEDVLCVVSCVCVPFCCCCVCVCGGVLASSHTHAHTHIYIYTVLCGRRAEAMARFVHQALPKHPKEKNMMETTARWLCGCDIIMCTHRYVYIYIGWPSSSPLYKVSSHRSAVYITCAVGVSATPPFCWAV